MTARWTVVVPVKDPSRGKTRLVVPRVERVALARAIALDTIAAATACDLVERVIVVGDDGGLVLGALDMPGLRFVPEGDARGLDEAVARGFSGFDRMPRAALLGDLPTLTPGDLASALAAAGSFHRAVVADAEGTGSTLVTAAADVPWASAFGEGSFARHVSLGCAALDVPTDSTLRRDVDTVDQLTQARRLGLGPRTSALLASVPEEVLR